MDHDEAAIVGVDGHDLERDALRVRTQEEDPARVVLILVKGVQRVSAMADDIAHSISPDAMSSSRWRELDVEVIVHILSDTKQLSSLTER
jgi:hypothetical protein